VTKNYTIPIILQGKVRSTKALQASERWFVEFHFEGKRHRKSDGLNRIKDYQKKIKEFSELRIHYEKLLIAGKFDTVEPVKIEIPLVSDAVKSFIQFQKDKGCRTKTIQSYTSKLNFLDEHYGKAKVDTIQFSHINKLLILLGKKWMPKTFNNCKGIYYGFFEYCIAEGFIEVNPTSKIKNRYVSKTEKHKVFTYEDFKIIMEEVDKDKMLSLFVKSIYYTCIRPRELMQLQRKHYNYEKNTIFIPAHISKNKRDGYSNITPAFKKLIEPFEHINEEFHFFCNDDCLYGTEPYHPNRPYKRFVSILKKLGMDKKGYTMYSFKHFSNVKKFLAGWSLAEIMKANRHASIEETENYLKDLLDFVDITDKEVPSI
jgi:integrase